MSILGSQEFDPDAIVPSVENGLFADRPTARFWVGRVATGDLVEQPDEYYASHLLRANVYIDQEGFLPPEARSLDGGEYDADDARSVQFGIVENREDGARLIGTIRLVEKRHAADPLPAEAIFPEAFKDRPAETGSMEISRLIARHSSPEVQAATAMAAIRAIDLYGVENGVPNSYAVLERPLYVYLRRMGVPCHRLSEPKETPEYGNTSNMVVRIDPREVLRSAQDPRARQDALGRFFDINLAEMGLGYFDETMMPVEDAVEA